MALKGSSDERLDFAQVRKLLAETVALLSSYEGQSQNVEAPNNKERMRLNSQVSRDLLYAEHLLDLARAEVMNQYHRFKGQNPPAIQA